jgi:large subunit ribosomal protein L3
VKGLIGKKVGMTSIYTEAGNNVACTVVEMNPSVVTQVKTKDSDGYSALQIAYGERKEKNTPKALKGHFAKAKTTPKHKVVELRDFDINKTVGDSLTIEEVFQAGDKVKVIGTSKGKGFQGVVRRHGFAGVGEATHGQHNRTRHPGSIGQCSYPAKVFKGMKMGGRMGGVRVTVAGLEVIKILPERNLLINKGAIPGCKRSYVNVRK